MLAQIAAAFLVATLVLDYFLLFHSFGPSAFSSAKLAIENGDAEIRRQKVEDVEEVHESWIKNYAQVSFVHGNSELVWLSLRGSFILHEKDKTGHLLCSEADPCFRYVLPSAFVATSQIKMLKRLIEQNHEDELSRISELINNAQ